MSQRVAASGGVCGLRWWHALCPSVRGSKNRRGKAWVSKVWWGVQMAHMVAWVKAVPTGKSGLGRTCAAVLATDSPRLGSEFGGLRQGTATRPLPLPRLRAQAQGSWCLGGHQKWGTRCPPGLGPQQRQTKAGHLWAHVGC